MSFLGEIKRRKVFQVAVVYIVVAWAVMQVVDVISEPLNLPGWFDTVVIVLLAIGFRHDRPVPLFEHQQYSWNPQRKFDYDSRSDRFLMIRKPPPDEFPENRIVIVQNWIAEVERKLGST